LQEQQFKEEEDKKYDSLIQVINGNVVLVKILEKIAVVSAIPMPSLAEMDGQRILVIYPFVREHFLEIGDELLACDKKDILRELCSALATLEKRDGAY